MSSFRSLLVAALVVLLAVLIGAPFYFPSQTVEGEVASSDPAAPSVETPSVPAPPIRRPSPPELRGRVTLLQPVIFPVNSRGKLLGHVQAKAGTEVQVVKDQGSQVIIRLVNSSVRVPRTVLAAPHSPDEESQPSLIDRARNIGERIKDYWLPGNTTDLRTLTE